MEQEAILPPVEPAKPVLTPRAGFAFLETLMTIEFGTIIEHLASGALRSAGASGTAFLFRQLKQSWSEGYLFAIRARLKRASEPRRDEPVALDITGRRVRLSARRGRGRRKPPRR